LIGCLPFTNLKSKSNSSSRDPEVTEGKAGKWTASIIYKNRYCSQAGPKLLQYLQALAVQLGSLRMEAGNIGTGPAQTFDDPGTNRIPCAGKDNRDRRGRRLRCLGGGRAKPRDDDIRFGCDSLSDALLNVHMGGNPSSGAVPRASLRNSATTSI
jgi:hypothetical protein